EFGAIGIGDEHALVGERVEHLDDALHADGLRRSWLEDFARLDARRSDAPRAGRAVDDRAHLLDVGVPTALGAAVRVADAHAEVRFLAADLAHRRHDAATFLLRNGPRSQSTIAAG